MTSTVLRLSVQYASDRPAPGREQVRRWVRTTLDLLHRRHGSQVGRASLTIRFVDEDEGLALNHAFRGADHATNVLTFSYADGAAPPADVEADIVVCMPVLEAEARTAVKSLASHAAHLVVHGTLHACGYDHEATVDAEAMEQIERDVLARFRIADPYSGDARTG